MSFSKCLLGSNCLKFFQHCQSLECGFLPPLIQSLTQEDRLRKVETLKLGAHQKMISKEKQVSLMKQIQ